MKLGTRLNKHRNSVQVCDLKSAVSEHAKDTAHSIDWASVKIIGQENHLLSQKICKTINTHYQQITATSIDGGIWVCSESSAKISRNNLLVLKNISLQFQRNNLLSCNKQEIRTPLPGMPPY